MGRRSVPRREVLELLTELEERGSRKIRRWPAGLDGRVEVTWEEGPIPDPEDERYARELEALLPAYGVTAGFVVLVALLVGIVMLL